MEPPESFALNAAAMGPPIPGAIMLPMIGAATGRTFLKTFFTALKIFLKKNSG